MRKATMYKVTGALSRWGIETSRQNHFLVGSLLESQIGVIIPQGKYLGTQDRYLQLSLNRCVTLHEANHHVTVPSCLCC